MSSFELSIFMFFKYSILVYCYSVDIGIFFGNENTSLPNEFYYAIEDSCVNATLRIIPTSNACNNPPHLIFDLSNEFTNDTIIFKNYVYTYGIPTISFNQQTHYLWQNITSKQKEILISFTTPTTITVHSLLTYVNNYNITNFTVLYTKEIETEIHINKDRYSWNTILLDSEKDHRQLLRTIKKSFYHFFIIGKPLKINIFLESVNAEDLFKLPYKWYTISKENGKIICISCKHANFISIKPLMSTLHEYNFNRRFLESKSLVDSYFYYDIFRIVLHLFKHNYFEQKCSNYITLRTLLHDIDEYGKYGQFYFDKGYQDIDMIIRKNEYLYNKKTMNTIGMISYGNPGTIIATQPIHKAKEKIQICVRMISPFVMKNITGKMDDNNYYSYGLLIDLLNYFKQKIHDFPDYELTEDGEECYLYLDIDSGHNQQFIYTETIFETVPIRILMKRPLPQDHFYKYITVLEPGVRLCILCAFCLTSITIAIFDKYSPYSSRNTKTNFNDDEIRVFTFNESFWFCFISLTPQGGGIAPRAISGKLVSATWWLFGFIVIASYTANLAAFLTVSRLNKHITSLDELSKQYKIRYSPLKDTAAYHYFKNLFYIEDLYYDVWNNLSLDERLNEDERAKYSVWYYPVSDTYNKIWSQMLEFIDEDAHFTMEEALKKIHESNSKEGFALIENELICQYFANIDCDFHIVGTDISIRGYSLPLIKDDPLKLKEKMNKVIEEIKLNGKLEEIKAQYYENHPKKRECLEFRKLYDGIDLQGSGGIFLVIGVGILLTFIVLSIELYIFTILAKREMKKRKKY